MSDLTPKFDSALIHVNNLSKIYTMSEVNIADAVLANKDYKRKLKLFASKLISEGELDTARAQLRKTVATQRSSEFSVKVASFERQLVGRLLKYTIKVKG